MGKKTANLPIHCEDSDVVLLDELCEQFDLFPPSRSALARTLLRFAMNTVKENRPLLKAVCQAYQKETVGQIGPIHFLPESARNVVAKAEAIRRRGLQDALDYVMENGTVLAEQCGFQDLAGDEVMEGVA